MQAYDRNQIDTLRFEVLGALRLRFGTRNLLPPTFILQLLRKARKGNLCIECFFLGLPGVFAREYMLYEIINTQHSKFRGTGFREVRDADARFYAV
jgi:hypothetical protein